MSRAFGPASLRTSPCPGCHYEWRGEQLAVVTWRGTFVRWADGSQ